MCSGRSCGFSCLRACFGVGLLCRLSCKKHGIKWTSTNQAGQLLVLLLLLVADVVAEITSSSRLKDDTKYPLAQKRLPTKLFLRSPYTPYKKITLAYGVSTYPTVQLCGATYLRLSSNEKQQSTGTSQLVSPRYQFVQTQAKAPGFARMTLRRFGRTCHIAASNSVYDGAVFFERDLRTAKQRERGQG